jgi:hypothetical protein
MRRLLTAREGISGLGGGATTGIHGSATISRLLYRPTVPVETLREAQPQILGTILPTADKNTVPQE